MKSSLWALKIFVAALSGLFTIAFFYLAYEVPKAVDEVFRQLFPELPIDEWESATDVYRPVGGLALAAVVALVAVGLLAGRYKVAVLGAVALYLPTFGYFALSMFLLAGLGVLRALWLQIVDLWPQSLKLGCVLFIPARHIPSLPPIATAAGALVFSLGVAAGYTADF